MTKECGECQKSVNIDKENFQLIRGRSAVSIWIHDTEDADFEKLAKLTSTLENICSSASIWDRELDLI